MAQEESGPNGPHFTENESDPTGTGGVTEIAATRADGDSGEDGSGPNGPHIAKATAAAAGFDGGATALEEDGSGPNGPH